MSWSWRCTPGEDYAMLRDDETGVPIIQTTHDVDPETPVAKVLANAKDLADALQGMMKRSSDVGEEMPWDGRAGPDPLIAARAVLRRIGRRP